jgi:calcineurin-like phosphoesterase family protein
MNYWFTADSHYGHANIIKYCKRPWKTAYEMDEALVANWNRVVRPEDVVYHLGDFAFKSALAVAEYRKRLNGRICFVEGNHDKATWEAYQQDKSLFEWYRKETSKISINNKEFFLVHTASRVWDKSHIGTVHLYGHSHGTLCEDPFSLSMDVGIDAWAQKCRYKRKAQESASDDYRPVSLDEVLEYLKDKVWEPIQDGTEYWLRVNDSYSVRLRSLRDLPMHVLQLVSAGDSFDGPEVTKVYDGTVLKTYSLKSVLKQIEPWLNETEERVR